MRSILEEFAYGNINPGEQSYTKNSELREANALVGRINEKLLEELNPEEAKLLEKLADAHIEASSLTAVQHLLYGYKLGVIMTAEAFVTSKDLIA